MKPMFRSRIFWLTGSGEFNLLVGLPCSVAFFFPPFQHVEIQQIKFHYIQIQHIKIQHIKIQHIKIQHIKIQHIRIQHIKIQHIELRDASQEAVWETARLSPIVRIGGAKKLQLSNTQPPYKRFAN